MKYLKIDLVTFDDWQGLYIDNKLTLEGHKLSVDEVLQYMFTNGVFHGQYRTVFPLDSDLDEFNENMPERFPNKWT